MDHLAAGMPFQDARSEQPDDVVTLDERALLVEQEAAVEVAIPGDTDIRSVREQRVGRGLSVVGEKRVRNAVREAAVRFMVNFDEFEG